MNRIAIVFSAAAAGALLVGCSALLPTALWPKTTPASPPTSTGGGSNTATAVSFKSDVTPILQNHCAACHSTGGPGASKVEMFNASGAAQHGNISPKIATMISQIKTGRMPLGAPNTVPSPDVKTLENWQAAGAPNN